LCTTPSTTAAALLLTEGPSGAIGLGGRSVAFDFPRASGYALRDVIAHGLSLAARRTNCVTDTRAASLKRVAGAVANVSSRVRQALANLRGQARRQPDRQARAEARARHDSNQKAGAAKRRWRCVLSLW